MSKKKESFLGRLKRWGRKIAFYTSPLWVPHAATQLSYTFNDIKHYLNPSPLRQEFKEEFGFPICGWEADVEEMEGSKISSIGEIIHREMQERPFDLASFRIESKIYCKRNLIEQVVSHLSSGYEGWAIFNRIGLIGDFDKGTVYHEVKHEKSYEATRANPEILERWRALAVDEEGNSLYDSVRNQVCKRIKFLDQLVDEENERVCSEENEKLGFVSDYARFNVWEDMAEFGRVAEEHPDDFMPWLYGEEPNQGIIKKTQLAEEIKLVPEGFSDYVKLKGVYYSFWGFQGTISDMEKSNEFMALSQEFLEQHPGTVYECELRNCRACVFMKTSTCDEDFETAIAEYKRAVRARHKSFTPYFSSLMNMAECYSFVGDAEKSKICRDAYYTGLKRWNSGDIRFAARGVNDLLKEEGILFRE
jgi:hypothetical protein